MKRMIGLMMAMFLYTFATSAFASQVFIAEQHPTTTIATAWNEFQTTGGGLDNANVWVK